MSQRKTRFRTPDFERDVLLIDGSTVHLRPVRPSDSDALRQFFDRLSPRSRYLRFHRSQSHIGDAEIRRYAEVDYVRTFGIVATLGEMPEERITGVGHYTRIDSDRADAAFAVEDSHRGRGIGTLILETLAQAACHNGSTTFEADVLAENHRMIQVFRDNQGLPVAGGLAESAVGRRGCRKSFSCVCRRWWRNCRGSPKWN